MVDAAAVHRPPADEGPCPFCDRAARPHVLYDTPDFYVMADIGPLVEGHTLIIARPHLRCLGVMPPELDAVFLLLKDAVGAFLRRTYGTEPLFWEHGVFGQSVFHLHMHCIPVPLPQIIPGVGVEVEGAPTDLRAIRTWFTEWGPYWYAEQGGTGYLCPPDLDAYFAANAEFDARLDFPSEERPFWEHRDVLHRRGATLIPPLLAKWRAASPFS